MLEIMIDVMKMWRCFRDLANKVVLNGQPIPPEMNKSFNKVIVAMREWYDDYLAFMEANKSQSEAEADAFAYMTTGDKDLESLINNDRY